MCPFSFTGDFASEISIIKQKTKSGESISQNKSKKATTLQLSTFTSNMADLLIQNKIPKKQLIHWTIK